MSTLAILVENYFSQNMFPSHSLTATTGAGATDEPSGTEAFRIATGRLSKYTNRYTPAATNTQILIPLGCGRLRAADGLALWPGHNLDGITVALEASCDNFATDPETAIEVPIPSVCAPGALDDYYGVRTEDGAWLVRFDLRAGYYWRLNIPALGAGVRPVIVGATLGNWWTADWYRPASEDAHQLRREVTETSTGARGYARGVRQRGYDLLLETPDPMSYDAARLHINGYIGDGHPFWLVHDTDQAERGVLAERDGPISWELPTDYGYRRCRLPWIQRVGAAA